MQRHSSHNDDIDRAFDSLLANAMETYVAKQEQFAATIKPFAKWVYDLDTCTLKFSNSNLEKTFAITPVATVLSADWDWCWVWVNDSLPLIAREKSARIKGLSEKTSYGVFTNPHFKVNQNEIDELCALSLQYLNGTAIFKVKDREPWLLFVVE